MDSINDLMAAVRKHPAYLFGAVFSTADLDGERTHPEDDQPLVDCEAQLVQFGNELLDNLTPDDEEG